MYRCWYGYSRMFKGNKSKIDENCVPIIKVPDLSTPKHRFLRHNMNSLLPGIHSDLFPLFFVSIGLRRLGVLPDPYSQITLSDKNRLQTQMEEFVFTLANLSNECRVLYEQKHTYETLREAFKKNEISIPAAAVYSVKFGCERFDLGKRVGLVEESLNNIFDFAIRLQRDEQFFTKFHMISKRLIVLWQEMEK